MSLYRAPENVIDAIEKLRRKFIWGVSDSGNSKICWAKWSTLIAPNKLGGLVVGSIKAANISLLIKWWWRMRNESHSLWVKVIRAIHRRNGRDSASLAHPRKSRVWLNIAKPGDTLETLNIDGFFTRSVGNGDDIIFWSDRWFGSIPLKAIFPDLYAAESNKFASLAMRFSHRSDGRATWRWALSASTDLVQLYVQIFAIDRLFSMYR